MTPYALFGDVLAPDPLGRAAVVVEGGRILEIVRSPHLADLPRERREVPGLICPGFIDLQVNGGTGSGGARKAGPRAAEDRYDLLSAHGHLLAYRTLRFFSRGPEGRLVVAGC
jgi:N-acetylglucosamine-6-phosphate deacetylase